MPVFWLEEGRPPLLTVSPRLRLKGESNSPKGNYSSVTRGEEERCRVAKNQMPFTVGTTDTTDDDTEAQSGEVVCSRPQS